jgi:hypothetical protein
MATAVISHAHQQGTADYQHLTPHQQHQFDQLLEHADNVIDAGVFNTLMATAADLAGITTSHDGKPRMVVRCACTWCDTCTTVFDTSLPGLRRAGDSDSYNLPLLQCPNCADAHPAPVED